MSSDRTLGAYLRRHREQAGLSLEAVSARSRIVPRLLRALEEDRHDRLPAPVYVRGFIRSYCAEVGAPVNEALALYESMPGRVGSVPPPVPVRPAAPPRAGGPRVRLAMVLGAAVLILGAAWLAVRGGRAPVPADGAAAAGGRVSGTERSGVELGLHGPALPPLGARGQVAREILIPGEPLR